MILTLKGLVKIKWQNKKKWWKPLLLWMKISQSGIPTL